MAAPHSILWKKSAISGAAIQLLNRYFWITSLYVMLYMHRKKLLLNRAA